MECTEWLFSSLFPGWIGIWKYWTTGVLKNVGKPEYPEKPSEQGQEPTTNSTNIRRWDWEANPGHNGGKRHLSPLSHPCSSVYNNIILDLFEQPAATFFQ